MRDLTSRSALFRVGLFSCLTFTLAWSLPAIALEQLNLPDNIGLPGRREGGGTRSPCLMADRSRSDELKIQAIVPQSLGGKTASVNPAFFVYIPPNNAQAAEFGIEDANGKTLYSQSIKQPISSGVISFNLPSEQASQLQMGQDYYWYFQLICDANMNQGLGTRDDFAEGWVRRVKLDEALEQKIAAASPRDRIELYAKEGLWYELLETLAQLRRELPANSSQARTLANEWASVLRHEKVQLDKLAQEPLVACCSAKSEGQTTFSRDRLLSE